MSKKRFSVEGSVGVIVALIGLGIQYKWPDQKWLGDIFIWLGCLWLFALVVWVIAQYVALRENKQSDELTEPPISANILTQHTPIRLKAPISNTNNPVFSSAPHNQNSNSYSPTFAPKIVFERNRSDVDSHHPLAEKPNVEPVFEVRKVGFKLYGFNLTSGHIIRETFLGDPNNPEHVSSDIGFVNAAFVKFYYQPARDADPRLRLTAHVFLTNELGEKVEVYEAIWDDDDNHVSKEFTAGAAHDLIVALVPKTHESPICILGYESGSRKSTTYMGSELLFSPKIEQLSGQVFKVRVEIVAKLHNVVRCPPHCFHFTLDLGQSLRFTVDEGPPEAGQS